MVAQVLHIRAAVSSTASSSLSNPTLLRISDTSTCALTMPKKKAQKQDVPVEKDKTEPTGYNLYACIHRIPDCTNWVYMNGAACNTCIVSAFTRAGSKTDADRRPQSEGRDPGRAGFADHLLGSR